jgi:glyoxalase family protein
MLDQIKGLHHVTSMAGDANANNAFFTRVLGLRRLKKTVNFDAPDVYHLYFGDAVGTPGAVMTSFPFGQMPRGRRGVGEVGVIEFAVPHGALPYWSERLSAAGVEGVHRADFLGEPRLVFEGPDGDGLALVETDIRGRDPWTGADVPQEVGILGFHGARFAVQDTAATGELLSFMGYQKVEARDGVTRYVIAGGNAADVIDLEAMPNARGGAGGGVGAPHSLCC